METAGRLVFRQSRVKLAVASVLCLVIAALGAFILRVAEPTDLRALVGGWLCLVLFGAGAISAALSLIKPMVIIIDDAGYETDGLLLKRRVSWSDIERIEVRDMRGAKYVAMVPTSEARGRRIWGAETIPNFSGLSHPDYREMLEDLRLAYLRTADRT